MNDEPTIHIGPAPEPEPESGPSVPAELVTPPITAKSDKAARRKWWKQANRLGYRRERPAQTAPAGDSHQKRKQKRKAAAKSRKQNRK